MTEEETRLAVVAEAKSWLRTPYLSNGLLKGPKGGVDCAMFLIGVYANIGLIPADFDPRPYPPQWHVHRNEEKFLGYVTRFAKEIETAPLPGDFVLFKIGLVFAHGAIVTSWPNVIHAVGGACVVAADVSKSLTGKRALWLVPRRSFSYWTP